MYIDIVSLFKVKVCERVFRRYAFLLDNNLVFFLDVCCSLQSVLDINYVSLRYIVSPIGTCCSGILLLRVVLSLCDSDGE